MPARDHDRTGVSRRVVVEALPPRAAGRICSIDDRARTGTTQVAM
jgi:hypothetical protein